MRRPRLPPTASRTIDLVLSLVLVVVALSALRTLWGGWPGAVFGAVTLLLGWLLWPRPVPDDEGCLACGHASLHHHGPCQACLRDRRDGRPSTASPCSRFRRWSPRSRWELVRRASGPRDALRALGLDPSVPADDEVGGRP